ncbi:Lrp/AsnC family transcriptional regulator [Streptomyces sennicomposti]|uniref:Lrp/AsnC family transcriptional regulator n=1 Tax=Streptomyces sennicomposti TaxID=2873384 RepID=UPI0027DEDB7A|nr:AsnC family transcriptional regulator [Streptomyces sennicomposti]
MAKPARESASVPGGAAKSPRDAASALGGVAKPARDAASVPGGVAKPARDAASAPGGAAESPGDAASAPGGAAKLSGTAATSLGTAAQPLGEDDLALIHALQLRPRASWTDLGRALGVDPVTVARRFARLTRQGAAWVGLSPGPRLFEQICAAFVEIDCAPGAAARTAAVLGTHPHLLTLERCAAGHDILATVAAADLTALSRYTLDLLPRVEGVTAVRARIVTHMFAEGGRWRIAALDPDQRTRLTTVPDTRPPRAGHREITGFDRALLVRLAHDGRASYQSLATALGVSLSSARRRLDQLVRLDLLRFRCDFARPLGGWPVAVTFRATAPPAELPEIGHALVRRPEIRNCAAVTGPYNLLLQASLHSVADVPRLEARLAAAHPGLGIADRTVTLRHDKLLGRLLDPYGRSVGVVPPDIWAEPVSVDLT